MAWGPQRQASPAPEAAELGCGHRGRGWGSVRQDQIMLTGSLCCSVGRGMRRLRLLTGDALCGLCEATLHGISSSPETGLFPPPSYR